MNIPFDRNIRFITAVALTLIVVLVYWPSLGNGFVFDDAPYVSQNAQIQQGISLASVKWAFTGIHGANWHPLTSISHMVDFALFELNPVGHHAVNLLFHLANTLLLMFLLTRLTRAFWPSVFVAALFALHPLHVESVAWVAERKDVLSTMFWLLTMWAYVRYSERPGIGRYALVFIFLALGLMSKPMLVTLPIVLLLMDFWPLGRVFPEKRFEPTLVMRLIAEKVPLIALSVASSAATVVAQNKGGAVIVLEQIPFGIRAANALVSYMGYLVKMVWPVGLAAYYPHPGDSIPVWQTLGSVVMLVGLSALAVRYARRLPYLAFGWFWYVITLIPVIGLVQVGMQAMADRYTYVPLIGIFIAVAWAAAELGGKRLVIPSCLILGLLSIGTYLQIGHWESDLTLFERAAAVTSGNYMAHNNLGVAYYERERYEEAIEHLNKALEIRPDYPDALLNLGNAYFELNDLDQAEEAYSYALKIDPNYHKAETALANVQIRRGNAGEAVARYTEALKSDPTDANTHYNMGYALYEEGRMEEAAGHFAEAIRIQPRHEKAHYNLGLIFMEHGRLDQAVEHLAEAARLKPDYVDAHRGLGQAFARQGKMSDAEIHLSNALRLAPNNPKTHIDLGILKATQGRIEDAVEHFNQAVRVKPDFAEAHFNLGLAMTSQGKSPEAIRHYKKTVELQPNHAGAHLNLAIEYYHAGDYAQSWKEVELSRQYGANPHPGFLSALREKMPQP